jgi:hypothetical protein
LSLVFLKHYTLRTDPYEFARITTNTYRDGVINHAWILYPMSDAIGPFLKSFEEFPPSQKPEVFTVGDALETIKVVSHQ